MWISMDFNGFPSIRRLSLIFVYFRGWGVVAYVAREVAKEVAREVVREVRREGVRNLCT